MTALTAGLDGVAGATTRTHGVEGRFDRALGCVTLALFSGPGMMFLGLSDDANSPPTPALRLFWPPVYALALLLCVRRWRSLRQAWPAGLLIAAPVLWAWASQGWSIAPDDTARRGLALFMTTLFGFALGAGFPGAALVRIVARTCFWLALGSAAVAVLLPRYGVEQVINQGCWRGLWDTKNALAAFMALGAVASACAALLPGRGRWTFVAGFVLCLFDLLMSQGKTSLTCLVVSLALLAVYHVGRRGPLRAVAVAWVTGMAAFAGALVALAAPDLFFRAIGKDPTLTGRTEIWTALLGQVAERPLGGYGYGAFWNKESLPARIIARQTGWAAPEAHNAWLDLLAQVGWIGEALTATLCLAGLVLAFTRRGRADAKFASVYVVTVLALSMAESDLLSPNSLIWVAFVAAVANLVVGRRPAAAASGG